MCAHHLHGALICGLGAYELTCTPSGYAIALKSLFGPGGAGDSSHSIQSQCMMQTHESMYFTIRSVHVTDREFNNEVRDGPK